MDLVKYDYNVNGSGEEITTTDCTNGVFFFDCSFHIDFVSKGNLGLGHNRLNFAVSEFGGNTIYGKVLRLIACFRLVSLNQESITR